MTTLRVAAYDPTCNVMDNPKVTAIKEYDSVPKEKRATQREIYHIINYFLTARPTWRFVAYGSYKGDTHRVFSNFYFMEDGERLGSVSLEYCSGSAYKIIVKNERIDAKRQRGSGYRTEDWQKAVTKIRKHFFKLGASERVEKVKELANKVISGEYGSKSWDARNAHSKLFSDAIEFAEAHIDMYLDKYPHLLSQKTDHDEKREALMVVDQVKTLLDKGEALIVVLDGERYIVVEGSDTTTYDNDSLPYHFREKLGLLKLVNEHQMISDVGCRVSSEAFVLVPGGKEKA